MHSSAVILKRAILGLALLTGAAVHAQTVTTMGAPIPSQWFVLLDDNADPHAKAAAMASTYGVKILYVYDQAMKGFAFQDVAVSSLAVSTLSADFDVDYVLQNRVVVGMAQTVNTGLKRTQADLNTVARIDGNDERINVNVAVVDTGIDTANTDLNVAGGVDCTQPGLTGGSFTDENGHGTHVAGIIGALDNDQGAVGVAPGAKLWSVRVLDKNGVGSIASVACGVDWITKTRRDADPSNDIAIANMSLGTYGTDDNGCGTLNEDLLHRAVCGATARGVIVVAASGNSGTDSNQFIPASYDEVITVSAIADSDGKPGGVGPVTAHGNDDRLATFSNYGADVDVSAPGVKIVSSGIGNTLKELSGTSQSTAFVTGAIALYVSQKGVPSNRDGVTQIKAALVDPAQGNTVAQGGSDGFSGDKDTFAEPLLVLRAPVLAIHDVAIPSITAPGTVARGIAVSVEATVKNEGTASENVVVTLRDDTAGQDIETKIVSVAAGASQVVTFNWTPSTSATLGAHTLTAKTTGVDGETDLGDNQASRQVNVVRDFATHDVAIVGVTVPGPVTIGQSVVVQVNVKNEGTAAESFAVTLRDVGPNTQVGTTNVTLGAGASQTVSFTFAATSSTTTGLHTLRATAAAVIDETDVADNNKDATLEVKPIQTPRVRHDIAVRSILGPRSVLLNASADFDVTVLNEGTVAETFTLELKDKTDGGTIGSQSVTLQPGESKLVRFTWATTTTSTVRDHLLEAVALAVQGEKETSDNSQTQTVRVEPRQFGQISRVADLDGFALKKNRNQWNPKITVVIQDNTNVGLSNATVVGTFSFGSKKRNVTCVTDATGTCSVEGGNFKNAESPVVFKISDVKHAVNIYQSSSNSDPDGDSSSGTSIVISN